MARYCEAVCRLCRRESQKLFLKGDRCYSDKCAIDRRNYAPGQHGQKRGKFSDYGNQLREKQKVKRMYGVLENQFRRYFKEADRIKGITGENLLVLLERRLDNVVYRLGFAGSRNEARQWVRHSHVLVNGKAVNVPSFLVRPGDVIAIKDKSRKISFISEALDAVERLGVPPWLEVSKNDFQGKVTSLPERKDITMPVQEQLIVELFSR